MVTMEIGVFRLSGIRLCCRGGKEMGRPWVGISFKLLTGLSQGNYGQLLEIGMQRYYKE